MDWPGDDQRLGGEGVCVFLPALGGATSLGDLAFIDRCGDFGSRSGRPVWALLSI